MIVNLLDDITGVVTDQTMLSMRPLSYDSTADSYDRLHGHWLRYAGGEAQCAFEGAVTALLGPDKSVLDAACGTGTVVRRLMRNVTGPFNLVLLDTSPKMLEKCSDIAARRVLGCMKSLPFGPQSFDLLTCAWGLETLYDPAPALAEFKRVTKPGGHICLVHCADRPAMSIVGSTFRHRISTTGRGKFLDHEQLAEQARQAGAKTVQPLYCSGPAAAMIVHV